MKFKTLTLDHYKLRKVVMSLNSSFLNANIKVWFSRWKLKTRMTKDSRTYAIIHNLVETWEKQTL